MFGEPVACNRYFAIRSVRSVEEGQQQGVVALAQGNPPASRRRRNDRRHPPNNPPRLTSRVRVPCSAPLHCAKPMQFAYAKRFGEVVLAPSSRPTTQSTHRGATRQNNDDSVRTGTNLGADRAHVLPRCRSRMIALVPCRLVTDHRGTARCELRSVRRSPAIRDRAGSGSSSTTRMWSELKGAGAMWVNSTLLSIQSGVQ